MYTRVNFSATKTPVVCVYMTKSNNSALYSAFIYTTVYTENTVHHREYFIYI
jgi:hypothetical protein